MTATYGTGVVTMGIAFDRITDALRAQQKIVRQTGPSKAIAQCPHDDHNPSLSVTEPSRLSCRSHAGYSCGVRAA